MYGQEMLKSGSVWRTVVKLAIPSILGTLITLVYNLTDTYFIGLLRDTSMLTAISLTMPLMWLMSSLGGIVGAGAPQAISLFLGKGDSESVERCRSFSVFGTLAISLALTPIFLLLLKPAMSIFKSDDTALEHSINYLRIIAISTPVACLSSALQGILRSDGRVSQATKSSIAGIVLNIALDPLFIFVFDMGMSGAALATALGSLATMVMCLVYTRGEYSIRKAVPSKSMLKRVMSLSLSTICPSVVTALTVAYSLCSASDFGGGTVASISVASRFYSIVVSIASAAAFSLQPFVGYNYGAENLSRLKKGIKVSVIAGTVFCVVCTPIFILLGDTFMRFFSDDASVITAGGRMLKCLAIGMPVVSVQMTCLMYLSATGYAIRSLIAGLSRQLLIFVPVLLVMRSLYGIDGLMLSYPITDILSTILSVALCFSSRLSNKKRSPI